MSSSRNRQAAKAVALAEGIPLSSRRVLLKMLGLLDDTGRGIAPDPPNVSDYDLPHLNGAKGDILPTQSRLTNVYDLPRDRFVDRLPPGLQVLPTAEQLKEQAKAEAKAQAEAKAAPKPERKPKAAAPRPAKRNNDLLPPTPGPQCGQSLGGRARHLRLGEALCDACRDYFNNYQRIRVAQRKSGELEPRSRPPRPACGSRTGAKAHRVRGEEVCEACLEARRAAGREEWRLRKSDTRNRINARRNALRAERRAVQADIAAENARQPAAKRSSEEQAS